MRTIDEVRERLLQSIEGALRHPGMWAGNDSGIQQFFQSKVGLLCWIDQCDEEKLRRALSICAVHDPLGIVGELASQHLNWPDYLNEVASLYAQRVHALNYWQPSRCLDAGEWRALKQSLTDSFFDRDWSESEILARFGTASYTVGGGFTLVHAYAPTSEEPWIYFDFARKLQPEECEEWLADPRLRDVRIGTHIMTPLPFSTSGEIGREIVRDDDWSTLEPRLEGHRDRETVDIVPVVSGVRRKLPGVRVQRISKRHPCDIYGAWYFNWEKGGPEIVLSSLFGFAPFFVGSRHKRVTSDGDEFPDTADEAIEVVVRFLESVRPD